MIADGTFVLAASDFVTSSSTLAGVLLEWHGCCGNRSLGMNDLSECVDVMCCQESVVLEMNERAKERKSE